MNIYMVFFEQIDENDNSNIKLEYIKADNVEDLKEQIRKRMWHNGSQNYYCFLQEFMIKP